MIGGLIRLVIRLAPLGILGAWLLDRRLRGRAGEAGPEPITTSVVVDAPIERVWAVLADIERQPEWMHDLKSVELLT
ncbi:MAG TPA: SRPBCC family protein, partial [Candidatus Limnocylindrales bacterium]|nr:SRPBCC family protein [Candidatus Limnocylindrales bacterium]